MTAPGLGFWKLAQEEPQHIAIVEAASGREITAGELLAGCNQVVHGLRALGLKRGDTIAAALKNESAVLELYLAWRYRVAFRPMLAARAVAERDAEVAPHPHAATARA